MEIIREIVFYFYFFLILTFRFFCPVKMTRYLRESEMLDMLEDENSVMSPAKKRSRVDGGEPLQTFDLNQSVEECFPFGNESLVEAVEETLIQNCESGDGEGEVLELNYSTASKHVEDDENQNPVSTKKVRNRTVESQNQHQREKHPLREVPVACRNGACKKKMHGENSGRTTA